ncbi:hypothetical protein BDZ97DRAFT_1807607 [Flammula alnicola]|nr:hypothetical protein BDZ97DRAFT_1807607 [Flammula alnicola]
MRRTGCTAGDISGQRSALGQASRSWITRDHQYPYSPELAQAFMDESFAIATQGLGNNSTDPGTQWSTCLACALVDCTRSRQHIARDGICVICFTNLRWDGKE